MTTPIDYLSLQTPAARRKYYEDNGYVVRPGLIPSDLCEEALKRFRGEIKPYKGHIYRQASANPEKHKLDSAGNMLNSLLNPISVNGSLFPEFKKISRTVLTSDALYAAAQELIDGEPMMVQSMYFEGNPATWAHQDTYYLDGERIGAMVAAWIALEDIHEDAGRFYIGPKSHLIDMAKNGGNFDIAFHHDRYKELVLKIIREQNVELRAPALKRGDALLWNSRTIHGSFEPKDRSKTRNSYTAHFIPRDMRFLQLQSIVKTLKPVKINEKWVHTPKDLDKPLNRAIFAVECRFPKTFQTAKKWAVKIATR